jgi:hypothetical protein
MPPFASAEDLRWGKIGEVRRESRLAVIISFAELNKAFS